MHGCGGCDLDRIQKQGAVVLVTSSFPILNDGSEAAGSFVVDYVEELARHVPVRVVAPGLADGRESWSSHIEIFRYAAPAQPLSTLKPWRLGDIYWIFRVLRGGMHATRAASANGAMQVFALWGLPCGEWARRVAREQAITYSVWLLGSDVWSLGRIPILRSALARVIRQATCAYADGYQLADDATRISDAPVRFLPSSRKTNNGTPPLPRLSPPYRLLFLGRWHPNKGVDLLLDALALLNDNDWTCIEIVEIQGGGPLDGLVRRNIAALQASGRPICAGKFLDKDEAEAAIVRADWLLIPSRVESIPVVFSDAMKLGRPVIAMPVGDLPRLIDSLAVGLYADQVSAESFANAMRQMLHASPNDRSKSLRAMASRFSLEESVAVLLRGCEHEE